MPLPSSLTTQPCGCISQKIFVIGPQQPACVDCQFCTTICSTCEFSAITISCRRKVLQLTISLPCYVLSHAYSNEEHDFPITNHMFSSSTGSHRLISNSNSPSFNRFLQHSALCRLFQASNWTSWLPEHAPGHVSSDAIHILSLKMDFHPPSPAVLAYHQTPSLQT